MIERPIEVVYRHLLELDRNPSDPDIVEARKEPQGATRAGTVFRFRHDNGRSRTRETTIRFTELEPNRRIEFEGDVGPVRPEGRFTLEDVAGGTHLTVRIDRLNPVGPLKLVAPSLARVGKKIWDGRLKTIKMLVEGREERGGSP